MSSMNKRERLEATFGPEYETLLAAVRQVRERVKAEDTPPGVRRRIFERLTEDDILAAAREGPGALRRAVDAAVEEARRQG